MGKLVGTYYSASSSQAFYLTVTQSDDYGGAVTATAIINGASGILTGMQKIGDPYTTVMLHGMIGENVESWNLNTSDFNSLNGSRNFTGPTGVLYSHQMPMGRI